MPKRLTPLRGKGTSTTFRFLQRDGSGSASQAGTKWASCDTGSTVKAFRKDITAPNHIGKTFYLTNSDLGLLGLLGAAITAPLSLALTGPASAYFVTATASRAVISSTGIAAGLLSSITAGALAGFIKPSGAEFVQFNQPCNDEAKAGF